MPNTIMPCHYCGAEMPSPSGKRYTPCTQCGKCALTVYTPTASGETLYTYKWRKDAANTEAVRLPAELARLLRRQGAVKLALDTLRGRV